MMPVVLRLIACSAIQSAFQARGASTSAWSAGVLEEVENPVSHSDGTIRSAADVSRCREDYA
jgi:hypothetical protein